MNDIITGEVMIDSTDFFDPREYRKCFTQDNEPAYVPIESTDEQPPTTPDDKRRNVGKDRKKSPDRCLYYAVDDIAEMLGVSISQAYKVIQTMNDELKEHNFIVLAGKLPKAYFHEKFCFERMFK